MILHLLLLILNLELSQLLYDDPNSTVSVWDKNNSGMLCALMGHLDEIVIIGNEYALLVRCTFQVVGISIAEFFQISGRYTIDSIPDQLVCDRDLYALVEIERER